MDGRQSVNSIAQNLRDSSLNVACYLTSLSQQGFVAPRVAGGTSKIQPAVDPNAGQPSTKGSTTTVNLSAFVPPEPAPAQPAPAPQQPTVPVSGYRFRSDAVAAAAPR